MVKIDSTLDLLSLSKAIVPVRWQNKNHRFAIIFSRHEEAKTFCKQLAAYKISGKIIFPVLSDYVCFLDVEEYHCLQKGKPVKYIPTASHSEPITTKVKLTNQKNSNSEESEQSNDSDDEQLARALALSLQLSKPKLKDQILKSDSGSDSDEDSESYDEDDELQRALDMSMGK